MISHPLIECSRGGEEIASASAVQLFAARKWSTNQTPKLFPKVICWREHESKTNVHLSAKHNSMWSLQNVTS